MEGEARGCRPIKGCIAETRAREVIAVIPAVPIQDVGRAVSVGSDRWENYWILLMGL